MARTLKRYPCAGGDVTAHEVAARFGVSSRTIYNALQRAGGNMDEAIKQLDARAERCRKTGRTMNIVHAERLAAERRQCDEIAERLWGKRRTT